MTENGINRSAELGGQVKSSRRSLLVGAAGAATVLAAQTLVSADPAAATPGTMWSGASKDPGAETIVVTEPTPTIWASPSGDDSFDGTWDHPVKTVQKAIDLAVNPPPLAAQREVIIVGHHYLEAPVRVTNVSGLAIRGLGKGSSSLRPGADLDALLDLNGVAYSSVRDLEFAGDAAHPYHVKKALWLRWDDVSGPGTRPQRSTTQILFDSLYIHDLSFDYGFAVEPDLVENPQPQNDQIVFMGCHVSGTYDQVNDVGNDYGFRIGNTIAGNVCCIWLYGCAVLHCKYGLHAAGAGASVFGGCWVANGLDFLHTTPHDHFEIVGVRSEAGRGFYSSEVTGAEANVLMSQCLVEIGHGDNRDVVAFQSAGSLILDNFKVHMVPEGLSPRILVNGAISRSFVTVRNLKMPVPPGPEMFALYGNARVMATGLQQMDAYPNDTVIDQLVDPILFAPDPAHYGEAAYAPLRFSGGLGGKYKRGPSPVISDSDFAFPPADGTEAVTSDTAFNPPQIRKWIRAEGKWHFITIYEPTPTGHGVAIK